MKQTNKLYWVDWYRNGFCYRSTTNVTEEGLKECKKVAKILSKLYGDKIIYEKM